MIFIGEVVPWKADQCSVKSSHLTDCLTAAATGIGAVIGWNPAQRRPVVILGNDEFPNGPFLRWRQARATLCILGSLNPGLPLAEMKFPGETRDICPLGMLSTIVDPQQNNVIAWKRLHYWPFVRGIVRLPVDSPHKPVMRRCDVSLLLGKISFCRNSRVPGSFRRHELRVTSAIVMLTVHAQQAMFGC